MNRVAAASLAVAAAVCLLPATGQAAKGQYAGGAYADHDHVIYTLPQGMTMPEKSGANLSYHGGKVVTQARVVFIFWGTFPSGYTTTLQAFRNQFGTAPEYNTITQYTNASGTHIGLTNLNADNADWADTSNPPTNVTDSAVQGEVTKYLSTHAFDASAIYEVVIPSGHYSSSGSSTSCGGPSLAYCAYHGNFSGSHGDTLYSIQPYPNCGGCSVSGWSDVQNQEHFVCHETREAVTDADGNAWYAGRNEADDKCAWSPTPFIGTGGYGYQYEWSNAAHGCVKTSP